MKDLLLITFLMLTGCDMATTPTIKLLGEVNDESGEHRLLLKFVEARRSQEKGYDFHSLDWESRENTGWLPKASITQFDFQQNAEFRRWVSAIHSFTPATGIATIQIGEEGALIAGSIHVTYSWREWDLKLNRELRTIKVCESPFDKLDAKPNKGK